MGIKRHRIFLGFLLLGALLLPGFLPASPTRAAGDGPILHATVNGVINPIKARYLRNVFEKANNTQAVAVIISVNTPGGMVESMQKMVTAIVNSPVPVVTFVEPQAGMATSAGTFIVLAGDVAAMVPGTTIGSAHPVGGQGQKIEGPMEDKVVNLLVSMAKSLSERRHRNPVFAEKAVTASMNLTAEEALETGVIDLLASNLPDLIEKLDGFPIHHENRNETMVLKGHPVLDVPLSGVESFLDAIANPSVAYILMSLGVMGLIYEFSAPGIGLGAVVGSICLLLGLVSLSALPIHLGGILLLLLGFIMLVLEFKIPSHGLLTVGGLISLVLGSFMLIDSSEYYGAVQTMKYGVVIPVVLGIAIFALFAVRLAVQALTSPPATGLESLVGMTAEVKAALRPRGTVFVDGALWDAVCNEGAEVGEYVKVLAVEGHPRYLRVERLEEPGKPSLSEGEVTGGSREASRDRNRGPMKKEE
ncbi:MAG: nodulation protein NfeD [Candidatus Hydrogenedentota bacterium]|nr:MAG: nodulation protein NfeD [Candidatus Hydrogenedentota bacterium]